MSGKTGNNHTIRNLLTGIGITISALLLLFALISALLQRGRLPQETVLTALSICLVLSSLLGSMTAVSGMSANRLLFALVPPGMLAVLMLTGRWFIPAGERGDAVTWPLLIAALLPGLIIGLFRKKKRRR